MPVSYIRENSALFPVSRHSQGEICPGRDLLKEVQVPQCKKKKCFLQAINVLPILFPSLQGWTPLGPEGNHGTVKREEAD